MAALFLFFVGQVATAQIEFGLKGGLNASVMNSSDFDINEVSINNIDSLAANPVLPSTDKSDYLLGFNAGVYAIFDLGAVNVMPEILYSTKGAKKWTTTAEGGDYNISSHYISVPVLVGLDIANIVTIQAGPQFGFLMDVKRTGDADGKSILDTDPNYDFSGFDLGAVLGVMIDWPGIGHLTARYSHGLTSSLNVSNFDYANRAFHASVGIPVFSTDKDRAALIP